MTPYGYGKIFFAGRFRAMKIYWAWVIFVVSATLLSTPIPARAAAGKTSVSLGAEYSQGDYGTSSTTKIWYFPVTLRYETDLIWFQ